MPHAGYSGSAYRDKDRNHIIGEAPIVLKGVEFDAFAVRGVSGLLIGPLLAHILCKQIIVVRKPQEIKDNVSHSVILVESLYSRENEFKYIFVDDMTCSGNTRRSVRDAIEKAHPSAEMVGSFYYSGSNPRFSPP